MKIQIHDIQLYDQKYLIFGRRSDGKSVSVLVEKHESYFYIRPRDTSKPDAYKNIDFVVNGLNAIVYKRFKPSVDESCRSFQCTCNTSLSIGTFGPDLASVCIREHSNLYAKTGHVYRGPNIQAKTMIGYQCENSTFVKIMCKTYGIQKMIKYKAMQMFNKEYEILEIGIDPIMRFMADTSIVGFGIIEIDNCSLSIGTNCITRCDLEYVLADSADIKITKDIDNYPLNLLSYDIECCSFTPNKFPKSEDDDPVIQIGVVAEKLFDTSHTTKNMVFCLDDTDAVPGCEIICYKTEIELLEGFMTFCVNTFDADVISGYNSNQFDMPYLLGRARKLRCDKFEFFSKMRKRRMFNWTQTFQSAQAGVRKTTQYNTPGVVHFDVFNYVKKTFTLGSYTLANVSIELLDGDTKEDMAYKNIAPYFKESSARRAQIASYCLQDTVLVSQLINVRKMLVNNIEFSRICGILLQHSVEKGVTYKITRKLLEYTMRHSFLIPTFQRNEHGHQIIEYYNELDNEWAEYHEDLLKEFNEVAKIDDYFVKKNKKSTDEEEVKKKRKFDDLPKMKKLKFKGAFVLDPKKGYHTDVVATLDFASLYPSEMRSKNMCTSTLLKSEEHAASLGLVPEDYERIASGFIFVKKCKFEGIMPMIETELFNARKAAKKQLKQAKKDGNTMLATVYDGKQLAVKLIMNSIYGYTGSPTSPIAALPIAVSITAQGRFDIMATKDWVEKYFRTVFCKDAPGKADVIYGDTDSVMVKYTGCTDVQTSFNYSEEIERRINSLEEEDGVRGLFELPMYLEFEKVFKPYYLLKKKKYIGLKYAAGEADKPPKLDFKGIETIRRDWSPICTVTQQGFIDRLIVNGDKKSALEYVRQRAEDLMSGELSTDVFVLSKKLSKFEYKNAQPHVEVAKKLQKLDPMNAPELGDRVKYFLSMNEHSKIAFKAEPVQMFGKALIDYKYYMDKQLKVPMIRLLEPLIGETAAKEIFKVRKSKKLVKRQAKQGFNTLFFKNKKK